MFYRKGRHEPLDLLMDRRHEFGKSISTEDLYWCVRSILQRSPYTITVEEIDVVLPPAAAKAMLIKQLDDEAIDGEDMIDQVVQRRIAADRHT